MIPTGRFGLTLFVACSVTFAMPLAGQSPVVTGLVRAQTGAPIAGASVEAGGAEARTGEAGRFSLVVAADTALTLTVTAVGFAPATVSLDPLAPGTRRRVALTLQPFYVLDAITVTSRTPRPLINTENATAGGTLEQEELRALPTDSRDPLSLAYTIPGVVPATGFFGDAPPLSLDGANSLYTQYTLDGLDNNEGFLGGPRVEFPLAALSRLSVLNNTYGAEYGRSSTGIVDEESRAGTDSTRGAVLAYWRPGIPFDAEPKLTPPGTDPKGFRRFQLGAGASGPLARDRTFYSLAAEYTNENEDRIGSTARTQFVGSELRQTTKLFGRLDHGWSPTQTTTLRIAFSGVSRAGQGTGVIVPEADITTKRIGSLTALTHRSVLAGGRGSNTASAQLGTYHWYFPPTASTLSVPQVTIVAPDGTTVEAVVGSSNFIFDEHEHQLQLRDVVELDLGTNHTLGFGADAIRGWFTLAGASTNPNGSYVVYDDGNIVPQGRFVSISDIPSDVRVKSYTIDANPQEVDLTQTVVGAFVQDRWRPTASLTVQAGLRWDYDDITSRGESNPDLNNLQPRVSFNWLRSPNHVIRGGIGLYTGKLPYTVYSDAVQFGPDGNAPVTFAEGTAFPPPAFGQGPTAADLQSLRDALPPREERRTFALGLQQPYSLQASLGTQLQLGDDWGLSVDGVLEETYDLPRSVDLNPISYRLTPADTVDRTTDFGDPYRPVAPVAGSYRRLTTTQTGGRSSYVGLYTQLRRRLSDAWTMSLDWVWSHAKNDTEDINFNAAQANCFSQDRVDAVTGQACTSDEWADGVNDRRHVVTLRSVYTVRDAVQLSVIGLFQTGQPVDRIAFFRDLDGSGVIYGNSFIGNEDRFPGVPRNGERLPSFFELDAGASWLLHVGGGTLNLRADVFNALNGTQWGGFANGIPGGGSRTQVGYPGDPIVLRSAGRPREVQFSAEWRW